MESPAACLKKGTKSLKLVYKFLKRVKESGTIARNAGSGKASKMTNSARNHFAGMY